MTSTAATSPTPLSSGDALRRQTYVDYIRSCYKNDPEAFSYYEALVDFIEKGSRKYPNLAKQKPRFFELRPVASQIQYPALFPFDLVNWSAPSERPRVAMLEGFPSPAAIVQLAQAWNLRPEFFIGHIFGKESNPSALYADPILPSSQDNVIRVHFSSLVKSLVQGPGLSSYMEKRAELDKASQQYEKLLFAGNHSGVTRFRGINQHDAYYCSVEQTISFTVVKNKASWVAVYLTDEGNSFLEDVSLPWSSYHNGATSLQSGTAVGTVPIVPYNKPIIAEAYQCQPASRQPRPDGGMGHPLSSENSSNDQDISDGHGRRISVSPSPQSFGQLHPPRNIIVHDKADMDLLSEDPFFLLASLFTTSALSFTQLLNYMSKSINKDRSTEVDLIKVKLERFQNRIEIIHRVEAALAENLHWIVQGGCSTWPRVSPETTAAARKLAVQTKLRIDHEMLQQRFIVLRQDCESAKASLLGYSQLLSGERSTTQAGEVGRLTKLAVFFVPLSFATSAFGMNVEELSDRKVPPLYVFAVVAVLTLMATYAIIFWSTALDWMSMVWKMAVSEIGGPDGKLPY
ncbi:hypothetical protein IL306_002427 [Fusarium sp. DS 682]|nr:hypothetical protein IL306_002427 [Fusarium sp. DS 682]